jgi:hypothetical protein
MGWEMEMRVGDGMDGWDEIEIEMDGDGWMG